jgi:hypothetical protein
MFQIRKAPKAILDLAYATVMILVIGCTCFALAVTGCVKEVMAQSPASQEATAEDYSTMHDYFDRNRSKPTPKFGLDPTGQAMVRDRTAHLDQERRIRLLERQVAQLQRIVFRDPTIQPPVYRDTVPQPIPDPLPDFKFGIQPHLDDHINGDRLVIPAGD